MSDRDRPFGTSSASSDALTSPPPVLPSLGFSAPNPVGEFPSSPSNPFRDPPSSRAPARSDNADTIAGAQETVYEKYEEEEQSDQTTPRTVSGLGIAAVTSGASSQGTVVNSPPLRTAFGTSRRVSTRSISSVVPIGGSGSGAIKSPSTSIKSPSLSTPPASGNPLLGGFPRDFNSAGSTPDLRRERVTFSPDLRTVGEGDDAPGEYERFVQEEGEELRALRKSAAGRSTAASIRSAYESDFRPTEECPTARDFYISRWSWLSVTLILLCVFSCVFSGIFLGIALRGPRWGRAITTKGTLRPADAATLTSIVAKAIELSFVTSFVAFLGQVLSRRAFMKDQGRGITLAEMSMWRWVVQPGTLITHWETAKYAGVTVLGILSLLSALLATLYSPAATALVQPVLKWSNWEPRMFAGEVRTSFANVFYVQSTCPSPIRTDDDGNKGSTCLQIEHAAQGYHNYQRYLAYWDTVANSGNGSSNQKLRPQGFAMIHENTTVLPKWVNIIDTKEVSKKARRAINNVSLAFPHSGVFQAARDPKNSIIQPEELDNIGIYSLKASVPSPVMHVLCANLNRDELKPIIYETWGPYNVTINSWPLQQANATTTNKTVVDDIFGWAKTDPRIDYPPVFARYPKPFNTIMNHSNVYWTRDTIYLLGQGGADAKANFTDQFVLCQFKATLTSHCSTQYNASGLGGVMEAICDDPADDYAYSRWAANSTDFVRQPDWLSIGYDWANSLSLNTGIMDGNASNSRLFTQLMMQKNADGEYDLSKVLPSPAEAMAVMAGCTLLMSSDGAPFVQEWKYTATKNILVNPQTETFRGSLLAQQYASGGATPATRAWLPVLVLVFLMNIFVLLYFLFHQGLVTDFSEPPNLFTLAVNSPPSHLLKGSCGGGPVGRQYEVGWFVNAEGDHLFMEPGGSISAVDAHGHTHAHGGFDPNAHGVPHVHGLGLAHSQAPVRGGKTTAMGNWASSTWDGVRDRLFGSRGTHVPVSAGPEAGSEDAEYELEQGVESPVVGSLGSPGAGSLSSPKARIRMGTRVRKQYVDLAKRRSML